MSDETDDAARKLKKLGERVRIGMDRIHPGSAAVMRREVRDIVVKGFSEVVEERRQNLERLKDKIIPERRMRSADDNKPKKEK